MQKTAIKWHGGKAYLAKEFVKLMPPHTRYCEPFFGGGAVLFARSGENVSEFVNDINYDLTNFWRVLQRRHTYDIFRRTIEAIPFSQVEFEYHRRAIKLEPWGQDINAAVSFFVANRQSRQGLGKDFATPTSRLRRGMNEGVSAWLSAVAGLREFAERLMRVEIRCGEAVDFIRDLDSAETFFYCDPPYMHETRSAKKAYTEEMDDRAHFTLLDCLKSIDGKFMLSGYSNPLYEKFARDNGWSRIDFQIDNKASGSKTKETKTEVIWRNY